MSHSLTQFYLNRAADERAQSEKATLLNVKNNHLRAAAAWDVLAARAERSDKVKADEAARKQAAPT